MAPTLHVSGRPPLLLEEATEIIEDLIQQNICDAETKQFKAFLCSNKNILEIIVAEHLALRPEECHLTPQEQWLTGSFNICIPTTLDVAITDLASPNMILLRIPLLHKLTESIPGAVDEKVNMEAATYMWMQRECQDIRIPQLLGFGFLDNTHVCLCDVFEMLANIE
jgi:hypothetical protein